MTDIKPGQVVRLSRHVQRITAKNPGPLTGPGTNTYILGNKALVVLDPGPADPEHIQAILSATQSAIDYIVVTHTHDDHSPAAQPLAELTGAKLIGSTYSDDGYQDLTFQAEKHIQHGDLLTTSELTLQAIHTPGHVGNHFCYLLKEEGMLFTGDHIMEGSTVVIIPPGGDMADYLDSLQLLKKYPIQSMAPGHGKLIDRPMEYIDHLINHRLKRENKVLEMLKKSGEISVYQLTPIVYDDVIAAMHGVASISLWAHLLKLEKEGKIIACSNETNDFAQQKWKIIV